MEIPTNHHGDIDEATEIIAAQAKEIEELQLVIVRLRDETQILAASLSLAKKREHRNQNG